MTLVWITVVRGVMAIVLGLGLAFSGDRAPAALVTFMGVYWMLNGLVTFQWGLLVEGPRRWVPLTAGAIGVVTGAVVLLVNGETTFLLAILGIVIVLTGVVHILGGFELADVSGRRWPRPPSGDSRGRARRNARGDVGPQRFPLHLARERMGAHRPSSASLRRPPDPAAAACSREMTRHERGAASPVIRLSRLVRFRAPYLLSAKRTQPGREHPRHSWAT